MMISDKDFHVDVLPRIDEATNRQDYETAWTILEEISEELSPEKKAHCYLLRGEIKEKLGDISGARKEWLCGVSFTPAGSYGRLTLQHELGRSYETTGERTMALEYYLSAIKSCAEGNNFSGRKPLTAFLALNDGQIPPEHNEIFAIAIQKSWRVYEFIAEPDLEDLPRSIRDLSNRFALLVQQTSRQR